MRTGARVRFRGQFSAATSAGLTPSDVGRVVNVVPVAGGSYNVDVEFPDGTILKDLLSDLLEEAS